MFKDGSLPEVLRSIERLFPDPDDPDRYECLAYALQLFAYRQRRHAEMLRGVKKSA